MTHQRRWGTYLTAFCLGGMLILAVDTASAATEATSSQGEASAAAGSPAEPEGALSQRMEAIGKESESRWAILPYRPTYILPLTYMSTRNYAPYQQAAGGAPVPELNNTEIKYQISFQFPVWKNMFGSNASLVAAYTQLSLWQAYNDNSAPFRDTNYEPEVKVLFKTNYRLLGFDVKAYAIGFDHQSNGRGLDSLSRSWNRIVADVAMERGNFVVELRPWWRIPEKADDDDNPDIVKYEGYADLRVGYKMEKHVIVGTLHNNLRGDENKGSIQLDWTFPLPGETQIKGYAQYFNGYAENLIDYNVQQERIGIGILLADWL
jgi:phospholipase A1